MQRCISRLGFISAAATAVLIALTGPAQAIIIEMCEQSGGIVVRYAEQPITREDKIVCPAPGKTVRIWCIGGAEYSGWEIFESGGNSRYR
jgi:hypothetical protein